MNDERPVRVLPLVCCPKCQAHDALGAKRLIIFAVRWFKCGRIVQKYFRCRECGHRWPVIFSVDFYDK